MIAPPDLTHLTTSILTRDGQAALTGRTSSAEGSEQVLLRDLATGQDVVLDSRTGVGVVAVEATWPGGPYVVAHVTGERYEDLQVSFHRLRPAPARWAGPGREVKGFAPVQLSPDTATCLVHTSRSADGTPQITLIDSRTGAVVSQIRDRLAGADHAWHPGGRALLTTTRFGEQVFVHDLATGAETAVPSIPPAGKGVEREPSEPVCWVGEEHLLVRQTRARRTLLSLLPLDGAPATPLTTLAAEDDDRISVATDLITVWVTQLAGTPPTR